VNISNEAIAIIASLATTITSLAGLIYKNVSNELTMCRAEKDTLREEIRKTTLSVQAEKDEWKRLALKQDTPS
jgi:hypothetical protein